MSNNKEGKEITKTWLAGQSSCTLVIPKETARQYEIDKPSYVVVEKQPEGILIKKFELEV